MAVLNLNPVPELEEKGRTAASVRAAREQKALEDAWQTSSLNQQPDSKSGTDSLEERYAQWLEKDAGRAKRNVGLFGQTILEEDDSSMDGY